MIQMTVTAIVRDGEWQRSEQDSGNGAPENNWWGVGEESIQTGKWPEVYVEREQEQDGNPQDYSFRQRLDCKGEIKNLVHRLNK